MRYRKRLRRLRIFFSQNIFVSRSVGGSSSNTGGEPHSRGSGSSTEFGCPERGLIYDHESEVLERNKGSCVCDCSDALPWRVVVVAVEGFLEWGKIDDDLIISDGSGVNIALCR
jgi:hypothetical protein